MERNLEIKNVYFVELNLVDDFFGKQMINFVLDLATVDHFL